MQLARLADCPALAMSQEESKALAGAAQNVLRHYSIEASQKAIDHLTLLGIIGFLYVPRGIALAQSRRAHRQPPAPPQYSTGQVFQFHPPQPPNRPPPPPPQPQPPNGPEFDPFGGAPASDQTH